MKYLFDGSSRLGFSVVQSAEIRQSSMTSGFFLSKHQASRRIPKVKNGTKNDVLKIRIFFIFSNYLFKTLILSKYLKKYLKLSAID